MSRRAGRADGEHEADGAAGPEDTTQESTIR
jgi:hypothetical protein